MSLHTLTVAELAAGLQGPPVLEPRAHAAFPRPHRAACQPALNAFVTVTRRARAGRCARRGRSGSRAGEGGPLTGRADRPQGHLLHRRHPDDLRLEDAVELRLALRRHRGRALEGGRHGDARQDEHGRVRDGLVERDQLLRPGAQPLGHRRGCRAAPPAARPRRSRRASRRRRPAPTPAARSASRRRCAASPASSPPTAACRATA